MGHLYRRNLRHCGNESVSPFRNRFDEPCSIGGFSERAAEGGYVDTEVRLLHEAVRPKRLQDFVLLEEMPAIPHEYDQQIEDLRRQLDGLSIPFQAALAGVQPEPLEFE